MAGEKCGLPSQGITEKPRSGRLPASSLKTHVAQRVRRADTSADVFSGFRESDRRPKATVGVAPARQESRPKPSGSLPAEAPGRQRLGVGGSAKAGLLNNPLRASNAPPPKRLWRAGGPVRLGPQSYGAGLARMPMGPQRERASSGHIRVHPSTDDHQDGRGSQKDAQVKPNAVAARPPGHH